MEQFVSVMINNIRSVSYQNIGKEYPAAAQILSKEARKLRSILGEESNKRRIFQVSHKENLVSLFPFYVSSLLSFKDIIRNLSKLLIKLRLIKGIGFSPQTQIALIQQDTSYFNMIRRILERNFFRKREEIHNSNKKQRRFSLRKCANQLLRMIPRYEAKTVYQRAKLNSNYLKMSKHCSLHENKLYFVCLHKGCLHPFLCRLCIKSHPDTHETSIRDLLELGEDKKYIEDSETQRDQELHHIEKITQDMNQLLTKNKISLNELVTTIKARLQEAQQRWIQELHALLGNFTQRQEVQEVFSSLQKQRDTLKSYTFREEDIFDQIQKIKSFNDDLLPRVKLARGQAVEFLESLRVDGSKVQAYREELIGILQGIHIEDFLSSKPVKSIKRTGTTMELEREEKGGKDEQVIESLTRVNKDLENQLQSLTKILVEERRISEMGGNRIPLRFNKESAILGTRLEYIWKLEEWMPRSLVVDEKMLCELVLVYRESERKTSLNFGKIQNVPVVVLVKAENERVFGGYFGNKSSDGAIRQERGTSFLFSLSDWRKYSPTREQTLMMKAGENKFEIVYNNEDDTKEFWLANKVIMPMGTWLRKQYYCMDTNLTQELFGTKDFTIDELEIYQVVLKRF